MTTLPHWKTPFVCQRETPTSGDLPGHPRHFHMWVPTPSSPGLHLSPCIRRLFPCGVCPCSPVPLWQWTFALFSGYNIMEMSTKTKVLYLCGPSQKNNSTRHIGNNLYGYRASAYLAKKCPLSTQCYLPSILNQQAHTMLRNAPPQLKWMIQEKNNQQHID